MVCVCVSPLLSTLVHLIHYDVSDALEVSFPLQPAQQHPCGTIQQPGGRGLGGDQRERQRQRETERETEREKERETERETEREKERDRETESRNPPK